MPKKRNLSAVPPESQPKSVSAESTSEGESRLKSIRSKPATRAQAAASPAASEEPVAVNTAVSDTSKPAKTVRARNAVSRVKKAAEPASGSNGSDVFNADAYRDEIARLAYSLWEERGRTNGSPDEDWLRAEAEVRRRFDISGFAA